MLQLESRRAFRAIQPERLGYKIYAGLYNLSYASSLVGKCNDILAGSKFECRSSLLRLSFYNHCRWSYLGTTSEGILGKANTT